ncbi:MAG: helix-turn-helix domain-containing protein, partial [Pseudomonadota bacterium]
MSDAENVDEIISFENKGFGNVLRKAREKKGLSLADVGSELRLDEAIIYALENQHLDKLPEPAYVCGYIRNYARFMELEVDNLVDSFKKDVSLKSNLTSVNSISQALEKKQEKRTALFLFFLVVVLAFG